MTRPVRVDVYCTSCPWEGDRAKYSYNKKSCPKCGAVVVKRRGSEFVPEARNRVDIQQDTQVEAGTFTAAEVGALKRVAMRELAAPDPQRSGQSEVVRMRLDSGLLAVLREHAEANGIALAAALGRAVALYLRPDLEGGGIVMPQGQREEGKR